MANIKVIATSGQGGFLNPPNDAEHTHCVVEGVDRGHGYQGYMSLRYALKQDWVPDVVKASIRATLAANPPVFTTEWEGQVYAYFKGCYSPDGVERNVSKCQIGEAAAPDEWNLAYMLIREFFPEYKPNRELILNPPVWGSVPMVKRV